MIWFFWKWLVKKNVVCLDVTNQAGPNVLMLVQIGLGNFLACVLLLYLYLFKENHA